MIKRAFHVSPVLRSVGVISAVAVLVGGVTFAALQSQATLTDNTISSASAGLLVDGNGDEQFSEEEAGFAFEGIVPGLTPSEVKEFSLKNEGDTDLKVKAKVSYNGDHHEEGDGNRTFNGDGDWDPTIPELPEGVTAADIIFTFKAEGGLPIETTWEQLSSHKGRAILDRLMADSTKKVTVQVSIAETVEADAIDIGSFDIVFTGKAISAEAPEEPETPTVPETPVEVPAPGI